MNKKEKRISLDSFANAKHKRYISPQEKLAFQHQKKVKSQYHWVKQQLEHQNAKTQVDENKEKNYYDKVFSGEIDIEKEVADPFIDALKGEGISLKKKKKPKIVVETKTEENGNEDQTGSVEESNKEQNPEKNEKKDDQSNKPKRKIDPEVEIELRKKIKHDRFYDARVEYELQKQERERIQAEKEERAKKLEESKHKRKEEAKVFRRRTSKGQPVMKDMANRLLAKIQKSISS